ncbi:DnaD domain protein [Alkaliphilus serpentinus]|uniref:DnaD domain protein n=2 Tax=Alkaliphilus serpentinus TaxID=1482731 RepID=A0A833HQW1_9FIRM|nr:DnaD domain protein [Alkaliphilus serpentinus]
MGFIKGTSSIDLGDTPIENIFIDVYMPMANGTYVKVYLMAYKYACELDNSLKLCNSTLAKSLMISLEDVHRAWDFWEGKGIVKKHSELESEEDYSIEFINLKQLYIDNNFKHITVDETANTSDDYSPSTKDLVEANQNPLIREMFTDINKIIARSLVPNDKRKIIKWFSDYNIDPPLIVKAFSYCKHNKNITSINYVGGVLRNWYDMAITTVELLEEYLLKQGERYGVYERVYKALGFSSREPAEADMRIMDKWVDDYGYSLEVILKACESTSKTTKPSINYINGILTDWHKKGVKRLEDIDVLDKKEAKATSNQVNQSSSVKTKFHLSKSRFDEYTPEELKSLLLRKQRNNS